MVGLAAGLLLLDGGLLDVDEEDVLLPLDKLVEDLLDEETFEVW